MKCQFSTEERQMLWDDLICCVLESRTVYFVLLECNLQEHHDVGFLLVHYAVWEKARVL